MRDRHDLEPVIAHRLERRDALTHPIHQYLPSPARNGAKARPRELRDDVLQRQAEHVAKMDELARAEAVDINLRELAFYMRQQIQVPLQGKFRMMPALHQDL